MNTATQETIPLDIPTYFQDQLKSAKLQSFADSVSLAETWVKEFDPHLRAQGPDAKVVKFENHTERTVTIPLDESAKHNIALHYLESLEKIKSLEGQLKT